MNLKIILIIEDHPDTRLVLATLLRLHGYGVLEARDGREGIDAARSILPDLIITDLLMPGMDGLQAARALRADARTAMIPIIAATGSTHLISMTDSDSRVFDAVLCKPIAPKRLLTEVRDQLEGVEESS
jgi:CheY-like chemotaxis protein